MAACVPRSEILKSVEHDQDGSSSRAARLALHKVRSPLPRVVAAAVFPAQVPPVCLAHLFAVLTVVLHDCTQAEPPFIIFLGGGMAAGKSSVVAKLHTEGCVVIEADNFKV